MVLKVGNPFKKLLGGRALGGGLHSLSATFLVIIIITSPMSPMPPLTKTQTQAPEKEGVRRAERRGEERRGGERRREERRGEERRREEGRREERRREENMLLKLQINKPTF